MPTGKIKYYNQDKGYGFIAQDEGEDLFFHILKSPSVGEIESGQQVEYEITQGKKGLEAGSIQTLLTPFEQRRLTQGKVVVPRDTSVWTPDTDARSRRQPEQRPTMSRERATARPVKSKPSPQPFAPKERVEKPTPKVKKPPQETPTPPKKPVIQEPPAQEELPPADVKQEEKTQKAPQQPTPPKEAQKKPQPKKKRRPTYGDFYMLKQIREKTPMIFEVYNHESIPCTVTKLYTYDLELLVDGEKRKIRKHDIKYCYKQENADKVRAYISYDESVRSQGLTPIIPRRKRYQIDNNAVIEARKQKQTLRFVMREGEIIMGTIGWHSIYEIKVNLPLGGNVIAFRHAAYDFQVLSDKAEVVPEKILDKTETIPPEMPETVAAVKEMQEEASESKEEVVTVSAAKDVSESQQAKEIEPEDIPLSDKIRLARQALEMSQKKFAESLGVSAQTIGNWERGKNQPQARYQQQIEKLLATAQATK